jgi:DNA modification methylase
LDTLADIEMENKETNELHWFHNSEFEPAEPMYKVNKEDLVRSPFSLYFINTRNTFPDNYPAKFDEELARMIISTWTKPGDSVLDPMAGSGTIPLIAWDLKRVGLYQDINPEAHDLYYEKLEQRYEKDHLEFIKSHDRVADSTNDLKIIPNRIDLILTSPPFGLSIDATHDKYSDNPDDLGNAADYDKWRAGMKKIIANCYKALKPGHLAIFETRLRSKDGHTYPLNMWIQEDAREIGFKFFSEIIEVVDYYRMVTYGKRGQVKPIPKHGYLTMLQKPLNEKLQ